MESKQKCFIGLSVVFAVIGVGLLVAAYATDNWVSASPQIKNSTDGSTSINSGNSSFGLFNGQQSLQFSTGYRSYPLQATCKTSEGLCAYIYMRDSDANKKLMELIDYYKNHNSTNGTEYNQIDFGLFSFPLWLSTIVFLSLSIVMGLVTIGFSIFNVFGRPIETVTGPMGLYLWNGLSLLLIVVTLAVFGALYETQLSKNFMMFDDYRIGWRSEGHTDLDFSFFFIVGAAGAYFLNFILLYLSGQMLSCSYAHSGEKEVDNGMILY